MKLTSSSLILSSGLRSLPPSFSSRRYNSLAFVLNDILICASHTERRRKTRSQEKGGVLNEGMQPNSNEERVCRNAYAMLAQTKTFKRSD